MPYRTPAIVTNKPTIEQQLDRIFDVLNRAPSHKWKMSLNYGDRVLTFYDSMATLHIYEFSNGSIVLRDMNYNILEENTQRLYALFYHQAYLKQEKKSGKKSKKSEDAIKAVYQKLRGL